MSKDGYKRKAIPHLNEAVDNFKFMQIDCDYYTINTKNLPHYLVQDGGLRDSEEYPVLRMYGVTEGGNSVLAHIHQFLPYLYAEVDQKYQDRQFSQSDLADIKRQLNAKLQAQNTPMNPILHIEVLMKESVMFYKES